MKGRWLATILVLGALAVFIRVSDEDSKSYDAAEKQYYLEHPKTSVQIAADAHFEKCWQYHHTSYAVWSDKQKATMLAIEGCYDDDRDDPRYDDATYPWNGNAPRPWLNEPGVAAPPAVDASAGSLATIDFLNDLKAQLEKCWNPPAGWTDPAQVRVVLLLSFNSDGSLNGQPSVLEAPAGKFASSAPARAIRAAGACAPYDLPADKYDAWKQVKVTFDPTNRSAKTNTTQNVRVVP